MPGYIPKFRFKLVKVNPDEFDITSGPTGQTRNDLDYSPSGPPPSVTMTYKFDYATSEVIDTLYAVHDAYVHGSALVSAVDKILKTIRRHL